MMHTIHRYRPLALVLAGSLAAACGDDESPDAGTGTPDSGTPVDMGTPDMGAPDMGVEPECTSNDQCSGDTPYCNEAGECEAAPRAGAIGWGDGSASSVTIESIHISNQAAQATDIEFSNVNPNELWVLHREVPDADAPCDQAATSGCFALQGSTTTIFDPGTPSQRVEWIRDFNAWHFMRRPPALAFGEQSYFATCGEARTGNYLNDLRVDFIGPTLWTSDPSIYKNWSRNEQPNGWNGTHMDMLHESPFCTGIAHDTGNAYWVVNGQIGSLDWYDFVADHGPGQADHSDGMVRRYATGTFTREAFVPGHIDVHDGIIYGADTGASRIVSIDISTATLEGDFQPTEFGIAESTNWSGATVAEVVSPGTVVGSSMLQQPSGLEVVDGILYVSDHATGMIHAFEVDGTHIRSLDTGLGPNHLAGLAMSPDGVMYFVDMPASTVYRIIP